MLTERKMDTKVCGNCKSVKSLSEFNKKKASKDGYQSSCKACKKEYQVEYRAANSEKLKDYKVEYYADNSKKLKEYQVEYRTANPEKRKESQDKWCAANSEKRKEYQTEYRAANPDYQAEYQKANPEKFRAYDSKRRAVKLLAIPSWLTKEDYKTMEAIYAEAKRLEADTGLIYHVDHIHPLQGKLICGLHCPANFQILTKSENCAKGNRFTPYVEN